MASRRLTFKRQARASLLVGMNAIFGCLFGGALHLAGCSVGLAAEVRVYQVDINRQSLDTALRELSRQTGLQVGRFSDSPMGDLQVGPISGRYTADQALKVLLGASGLAFRRLNDRAFIVVTPEALSSERAPVDAVRAGSSGCFLGLCSTTAIGSTETCSKQTPGEARMASDNCKTKWSYLVAGLLGAGATLAAGSGYAQSASGSATQNGQQTSEASLEEVVVTAERRSEDVQKIANSVSVRRGADLLAAGKFSLRDILEDVPGIGGGAASTPAGSSAPGVDTLAAGLNIRGIRSNTGPGGSITSVAPAAAIYVDGVYEGVGGGYDIDRVEVLRGPQGTLYGRSATTGVVAIHTHDPELSKFGGNVSLEAGNYSLRHYTGGVNIPVGEKAALRVAGNKYEREGFDSPKGGAVESTDAKVKFLYEPTDSLSMLFGAAMQDNTPHSGGVAIGLNLNGDPNKILFDYSPGNDIVSSGENKYRQYWAELNWKTSLGTLTYLPAYRSWESRIVQIIRSAVSQSDALSETPNDKFVTHELRFASNPESPVKWLVGTLFYANDLDDHRASYVAPPGYPTGLRNNEASTSRETTANGVFGEATVPFGDTWRLTGGLRFDRTKVESEQDYYSGASNLTLHLSRDAGTRTFENITYKLRLEHDLTPDNLLYASVSTGFSPGDVVVTQGLSNAPEAIELQDETLTAYEIGSKNQFLDDSLRLNVSAYYNDFAGYQVANAALATVFSPLLGRFAPQFGTLNAPVKSYGAELELLYGPTPSDLLAFNVAYTNSKYKDKNIPIGTTGKTFGDFFARDNVEGIVPVDANLSYTHSFVLPRDARLSLRGEVRYESAHDAGRIALTHLNRGYLPWVRVEGKVIGNLSAMLSFNERVSLSAYVRNVGDRRYKVNPALFDMGPTVAATVSVSDPRTYGMVLNITF